MSIVSALAFIGSQNSTVNGLSQICDGMTKVNMMPRFFSRKNRYWARGGHSLCDDLHLPHCVLQR